MRARPISFGIAYAVVCSVLAVMIGGAGHGWVTPFQACWTGFVVFPLAFISLADWRKPAGMNRVIVALVVAVAVDGWVLSTTLQEGLHYVATVATGAYLWIALWLGGQAPIAIALARRLGGTGNSA